MFDFQLSSDGQKCGPQSLIDLGWLFRIGSYFQNKIRRFALYRTRLNFTQLQKSTLNYSAGQCSAGQYSAVQCSAVKLSALQ